MILDSLFSHHRWRSFEFRSHLMFIGFLIYTIFVSLCKADTARLLDPPPRGSLWRYGYVTPINYHDGRLNCGWDKLPPGTKPQCGVCGDAIGTPQNHDNGGIFDSKIIVKNYTQGTSVQLTFHIASEARGVVGVQLCPLQSESDSLSDDCFDANTLLIDDVSVNKRNIWTTKGNNLPQTISVSLPVNLTCEHCVIRWRYTIDDPRCPECDVKETYINCADISITHPREITTPLYKNNRKSRRKKRQLPPFGINPMNMRPTGFQFTNNPRMSEHRDNSQGQMQSQLNHDQLNMQGQMEGQMMNHMQGQFPNHMNSGGQNHFQGQRQFDQNNMNLQNQMTDQSHNIRGGRIDVQQVPDHMRQGEQNSKNNIQGQTQGHMDTGLINMQGQMSQGLRSHMQGHLLNFRNQNGQNPVQGRTHGQNILEHGNQMQGLGEINQHLNTNDHGNYKDRFSGDTTNHEQFQTGQMNSFDNRNSARVMMNTNDKKKHHKRDQSSSAPQHTGFGSLFEFNSNMFHSDPSIRQQNANTNDKSNSNGKIRNEGQIFQGNSDPDQLFSSSVDQYDHHSPKSNNINRHTITQNQQPDRFFDNFGFHTSDTNVNGMHANTNTGNKENQKMPKEQSVNNNPSNDQYNPLQMNDQHYSLEYNDTSSSPYAMNRFPMNDTFRGEQHMGTNNTIHDLLQNERNEMNKNAINSHTQVPFPQPLVPQLHPIGLPGPHNRPIPLAPNLPHAGQVPVPSNVIPVAPLHPVPQGHVMSPLANIIPLGNVVPINPTVNAMPKNPMNIVVPNDPTVNMVPGNPVVNVVPSNQMINVVPSNQVVNMEPNNLISNVPSQNPQNIELMKTPSFVQGSNRNGELKMSSQSRVVLPSPMNPSQMMLHGIQRVDHFIPSHPISQINPTKRPVIIGNPSGALPGNRGVLKNLHSATINEAMFHLPNSGNQQQILPEGNTIQIDQSIANGEPPKTVIDGHIMQEVTLAGDHQMNHVKIINEHGTSRIFGKIDTPINVEQVGNEQSVADILIVNDPADGHVHNNADNLANEHVGINIPDNVQNNGMTVDSMLGRAQEQPNRIIESLTKQNVVNDMRSDLERIALGHRVAGMFHPRKMEKHNANNMAIPKTELPIGNTEVTSGVHETIVVHVPTQSSTMHETIMLHTPPQTANLASENQINARQGNGNTNVRDTPSFDQLPSDIKQPQEVLETLPNGPFNAHQPVQEVQFLHHGQIGHFSHRNINFIKNGHGSPIINEHTGIQEQLDSQQLQIQGTPLSNNIQKEMKNINQHIAVHSLPGHHQEIVIDLSPGVHPNDRIIHTDMPPNQNAFTTNIQGGVKPVMTGTETNLNNVGKIDSMSSDTSNIEQISDSGTNGNTHFDGNGLLFPISSDTSLSSFDTLIPSPQIESSGKTNVKNPSVQNTVTDLTHGQDIIDIIPDRQGHNVQHIELHAIPGHNQEIVLEIPHGVNPNGGIIHTNLPLPNHQIQVISENQRDLNSDANNENTGDGILNTGNIGIADSMVDGRTQSELFTNKKIQSTAVDEHSILPDISKVQDTANRQNDVLKNIDKQHPIVVNRLEQNELKATDQTVMDKTVLGQTINDLTNEQGINPQTPDNSGNIQHIGLNSLPSLNQENTLAITSRNDGIIHGDPPFQLNHMDIPSQINQQHELSVPNQRGAESNLDRVGLDINHVDSVAFVTTGESNLDQSNSNNVPNANENGSSLPIGGGTVKQHHDVSRQSDLHSSAFDTRVGTRLIGTMDKTSLEQTNVLTNEQVSGHQHIENTGSNAHHTEIHSLPDHNQEQIFVLSHGVSPHVGIINMNVPSSNNELKKFSDQIQNVDESDVNILGGNINDVEKASSVASNPSNMNQLINNDLRNANINDPLLPTNSDQTSTQKIPREHNSGSKQINSTIMLSSSLGTQITGTTGINTNDASIDASPLKENLLNDGINIQGNVFQSTETTTPVTSNHISAASSNSSNVEKKSSDSVSREKLLQNNILKGYTTEGIGVLNDLKTEKVREMSTVTDSSVTEEKSTAYPNGTLHLYKTEVIRHIPSKTKVHVTDSSGAQRLETSGHKNVSSLHITKNEALSRHQAKVAAFNSGLLSRNLNQSVPTTPTEIPSNNEQNNKILLHHDNVAAFNAGELTRQTTHPNTLQNVYLNVDKLETTTPSITPEENKNSKLALHMAKVAAFNSGLLTAKESEKLLKTTPSPKLYLEQTTLAIINAKKPIDLSSLHAQIIAFEGTNSHGPTSEQMKTSRPESTDIFEKTTKSMVTPTQNPNPRTTEVDPFLEMILSFDQTEGSKKEPLFKNKQDKSPNMNAVQTDNSRGVNNTNTNLLKNDPKAPSALQQDSPMIHNEDIMAFNMLNSQGKNKNARAKRHTRKQIQLLSKSDIQFRKRVRRNVVGRGIKLRVQPTRPPPLIFNSELYTQLQNNILQQSATVRPNEESGWTLNGQQNTLSWQTGKFNNQVGTLGSFTNRPHLNSNTGQKPSSKWHSRTTKLYTQGSITAEPSRLNGYPTGQFVILSGLGSLVDSFRRQTTPRPFEKTTYPHSMARTSNIRTVNRVQNIGSSTLWRASPPVSTVSPLSFHSNSARRMEPTTTATAKTLTDLWKTTSTATPFVRTNTSRYNVVSTDNQTLNTQIENKSVIKERGDLEKEKTTFGSTSTQASGTETTSISNKYFTSTTLSSITTETTSTTTVTEKPRMFHPFGKNKDGYFVISNLGQFSNLQKWLVPRSSSAKPTTPTTTTVKPKSEIINIKGKASKIDVTKENPDFDFVDMSAGLSGIRSNKTLLSYYIDEHNNIIKSSDTPNILEMDPMKQNTSLKPQTTILPTQSDVSTMTNVSEITTHEKPPTTSKTEENTTLTPTTVYTRTENTQDTTITSQVTNHIPSSTSEIAIDRLSTSESTHFKTTGHTQTPMIIGRNTDITTTDSSVVPLTTPMYKPKSRIDQTPQFPATEKSADVTTVDIFSSVKPLNDRQYFTSIETTATYKTVTDNQTSTSSPSAGENKISALKEESVPVLVRDNTDDNNIMYVSTQTMTKTSKAYKDISSTTPASAQNTNEFTNTRLTTSLPRQASSEVTEIDKHKTKEVTNAPTTTSFPLLISSQMTESQNTYDNIVLTTTKPSTQKSNAFRQSQRTRSQNSSPKYKTTNVSGILQNGVLTGHSSGMARLKSGILADDKSKLQNGILRGSKTTSTGILGKDINNNNKETGSNNEKTNRKQNMVVSGILTNENESKTTSILLFDLTNTIGDTKSKTAEKEILNPNQPNAISGILSNDVETIPYVTSKAEVVQNKYRGSGIDKNGSVTTQIQQTHIDNVSDSTYSNESIANKTSAVKDKEISISYQSRVNQSFNIDLNSLVRVENSSFTTTSTNATKILDYLRVTDKAVTYIKQQLAPSISPFLANETLTKPPLKRKMSSPKSTISPNDQIEDINFGIDETKGHKVDLIDLSSGLSNIYGENTRQYTSNPINGKTSNVLWSSDFTSKSIPMKMKEIPETFTKQVQNDVNIRWGTNLTSQSSDGIPIQMPGTNTRVPAIQTFFTTTSTTRSDSKEQNNTRKKETLNPTKMPVVDSDAKRDLVRQVIQHLMKEPGDIKIWFENSKIKIHIDPDVVSAVGSAGNSNLQENKKGNSVGDTSYVVRNKVTSVTGSTKRVSPVIRNNGGDVTKSTRLYVTVPAPNTPALITSEISTSNNIKTKRVLHSGKSLITNPSFDTPVHKLSDGKGKPSNTQTYATSQDLHHEIKKHTNSNSIPTTPVTISHKTKPEQADNINDITDTTTISPVTKISTETETIHSTTTTGKPTMTPTETTTTYPTTTTTKLTTTYPTTSTTEIVTKHPANTTTETTKTHPTKLSIETTTYPTTTMTETTTTYPTTSTTETITTHSTMTMTTSVTTKTHPTTTSTEPMKAHPTTTTTESTTTQFIPVTNKIIATHLTTPKITTPIPTTIPPEIIATVASKLSTEEPQTKTIVSRQKLPDTSTIIMPSTTFLSYFPHSSNLHRYTELDLLAQQELRSIFKRQTRKSSTPKPTLSSNILSDESVTATTTVSTTANDTIVSTVSPPTTETNNTIKTDVFLSDGTSTSSQISSTGSYIDGTTSAAADNKMMFQSTMVTTLSTTPRNEIIHINPNETESKNQYYNVSKYVNKDRITSLSLTDHPNAEKTRAVPLSISQSATQTSQSTTFKPTDESVISGATITDRIALDSTFTANDGAKQNSSIVYQNITVEDDNSERTSTESIITINDGTTQNSSIVYQNTPVGRTVSDNSERTSTEIDITIHDGTKQSSSVAYQNTTVGRIVGDNSERTSTESVITINDGTEHISSIAYQSTTSGNPVGRIVGDNSEHTTTERTVTYNNENKQISSLTYESATNGRPLIDHSENSIPTIAVSTPRGNESKLLNAMPNSSLHSEPTTISPLKDYPTFWPTMYNALWKKPNSKTTDKMSRIKFIDESTPQSDIYQTTFEPFHRESEQEDRGGALPSPSKTNLQTKTVENESTTKTTKPTTKDEKVSYSKTTESTTTPQIKSTQSKITKVLPDAITKTTATYPKPLPTTTTTYSKTPTSGRGTTTTYPTENTTSTPIKTQPSISAGTTTVHSMKYTTNTIIPIKDNNTNAINSNEIITQSTKTGSKIFTGSTSPSAVNYTTAINGARITTTDASNILETTTSSKLNFSLHRNVSHKTNDLTKAQSIIKTVDKITDAHTDVFHTTTAKTEELQTTEKTSEMKHRTTNVPLTSTSAVFESKNNSVPSTTEGYDNSNYKNHTIPEQKPEYNEISTSALTTQISETETPNFDLNSPSSGRNSESNNGKTVLLIHSSTTDDGYPTTVTQDITTAAVDSRTRHNLNEDTEASATHNISDAQTVSTEPTPMLPTNTPPLVSTIPEDTSEQNIISKSVTEIQEANVTFNYMTTTVNGGLSISDQTTSTSYPEINHKRVNSTLVTFSEKSTNITTENHTSTTAGLKMTSQHPTTSLITTSSLPITSPSESPLSTTTAPPMSTTTQSIQSTTLLKTRSISQTSTTSLPLTTTHYISPKLSTTTQLNNLTHTAEHQHKSTSVSTLQTAFRRNIQIKQAQSLQHQDQGKTRTSAPTSSIIIQTTKKVKPTTVPRNKVTGVPLFTSNIITQLPFQYAPTIRRKTPGGGAINIKIRLITKELNENTTSDNYTNIKDSVIDRQRIVNASDGFQYSTNSETVMLQTADNRGEFSISMDSNTEIGTNGEVKFSHKTNVDEKGMRNSNSPELSAFEHSSHIVRKIRSTRRPLPTSVTSLTTELMTNNTSGNKERYQVIQSDTGESNINPTDIDIMVVPTSPSDIQSLQERIPESVQTKTVTDGKWETTSADHMTTSTGAVIVENTSSKSTAKFHNVYETTTMSTKSGKETNGILTARTDGKKSTKVYFVHGFTTKYDNVSPGSLIKQDKSTTDMAARQIRTEPTRSSHTRKDNITESKIPETKEVSKQDMSLIYQSNTLSTGENSVTTTEVNSHRSTERVSILHQGQQLVSSQSDNRRQGGGVIVPVLQPETVDINAHNIFHGSLIDPHLNQENNRQYLSNLNNIQSSHTNRGDVISRPLVNSLAGGVIIDAQIFNDANVGSLSSSKMQSQSNENFGNSINSNHKRILPSNTFSMFDALGNVKNRKEMPANVKIFPVLRNGVTHRRQSLNGFEKFNQKQESGDHLSFPNENRKAHHRLGGNQHQNHPTLSMNGKVNIPQPFNSDHGQSLKTPHSVFSGAISRPRMTSSGNNLHQNIIRGQTTNPPFQNVDQYPVVRQQKKSPRQPRLLSAISVGSGHSSLGISFGDNVGHSISGHSGGLSQPAPSEQRISGRVSSSLSTGLQSSMPILHRHTKRNVRSTSSVLSTPPNTPAETVELQSSIFIVDAQELCTSGEVFACFGKNRHSNLPGIKWWCVQHCRYGNCPHSKCRCGCQKKGSPNLRNVQFSLAKHQVNKMLQTTTVSSKRRRKWNCRPTSAYTPIEGIGEWCNRMCSLNACAKHICDCS